MISHKEDFKKWTKERNKEIFRKLSEVQTTFNKELSAGQTCTFTNKFGVQFPGLTIMGFCKPTLGEKCVYLDSSSYWFPVPPDSITLANKDKLVTMDTALSMRDMEFDEECESIFTRDFKICKRSTTNYPWCEIIVNLPTQTRAVQWMKEDKGVVFDIVWNYFDGSELSFSAFAYHLSDKECIYSSANDKISFSTYELALETALNETLALFY